MSGTTPRPPEAQSLALVDGRRVVDELPVRVSVTPEEIELVSQHLHAIVAGLFGDMVEAVK